MQYFTRAPGGEEFGPFSSDQLRELVRSGRLGPGNHVRRETGSSWSRFEDIPALAEAFDSLQDAVGLSPSHAQAAELKPEAPRPFLAEREALSPAAEPNANPFVSRGVLVKLLPGEELLFVLEQSFLDSLRNSMLAAITGKRGVMICTSRRVVVSQPTFSSSATEIAFLDRVGVVSRKSNLSKTLVIGGAFLLLFGASGLLGAMAMATSSFAAAGIASIFYGLFAMIGAVMILLSRRKVMIVYADAPVVFVCGAAGDWHLGQLDAARMACMSDGERVERS